MEIDWNASGTRTRARRDERSIDTVVENIASMLNASRGYNIYTSKLSNKLFDYYNIIYF